MEIINENEITAADILKSLVVSSNMGSNKPMSAVSISMATMDEKTENYAENDKVTLIDVGLSFVKTDGYMEVNLIFSDSADMRLILANGLINTYRALLSDGYYDDDTDFYPPYLSMMFTPMEYEGQYHFVGEAPIFYCLCSDDPKVLPHILKFVFEEDSFVLIKTPGMDAKRIISNIKRQIEEDDKRALYEAEQLEKIERENEYEEAKRAERFS